jgi:predicted phosphodiesterase
MIGIMADSHGKPETILAALDVLKGLNCRRIYHLGDVCDSTRPETAEACLGPLREQRVITIKGNNDHAIVANHLGRKEAPISSNILKYIQHLPLVQNYNDAVFTHSLPFAARLGLACMIGSMSEKEAHRSFIEFPHHVIFRGHSHMPEILRLRRRRIESRTPALGLKIDLAGKLPCVVTCGSLTRGFCMIWDEEENYVSVHRFKVHRSRFRLDL